MTLTLIGSLINGASEAFWGMRKGRMQGNDPEIDTAQTPKRFDWRLENPKNFH